MGFYAIFLSSNNIVHAAFLNESLVRSLFVLGVKVKLFWRKEIGANALIKCGEIDHWCRHASIKERKEKKLEKGTDG
jgi:hypothetical protein